MIAKLPCPNRCFSGKVRFYPDQNVALYDLVPCPVCKGSRFISESFPDGTPMCLDIAPGSVAACVPFPTSKDDFYRTPTCKLPQGHSGYHLCGEFYWPGPIPPRE